MNLLIKLAEAVCVNSLSGWLDSIDSMHSIPLITTNHYVAARSCVICSFAHLATPAKPTLVVTVILVVLWEVHLLTVLLCYSWQASRTTPSISRCTYSTYVPSEAGWQSSQPTSQQWPEFQAPTSGKRGKKTFFSFPVVVLLLHSGLVFLQSGYT